MPSIQLPDTRPSLTHKREVCGFKMYVTVTFFGPENGEWDRPMEIFVQIAKQGTIVGGLLDGICVLLSTALRRDVPWVELREKLLGHRFEDNGDPLHSSLLDGLAKCVDHLVSTRAEQVR